MPLEEKGLEAGAQAPGFDLPEVEGGTVALEELLGNPVILVFYRGGW
jgi:peroxiredoxin